MSASDKCDKESECLSFEQHMQAAQWVWNDLTQRPSTGAATPSLLFTTESINMVQQQVNYTAAAYQSMFRIVSNTHDVTPDTGFITNAAAVTSYTADMSQLSAITSLQFQLLARITLGNCCSNFHTLLNDLLLAGCGAAPSSQFVCFQELENPHWRLCCGWVKDCQATKMQAIQAWDDAKNKNDSRIG